MDWGISLGKTHMLVFLVFVHGELYELEARTVIACLWVAKATEPVPLYPNFNHVFKC
jgi:hypothetical protein